MRSRTRHTLALLSVLAIVALPVACGGDGGEDQAADTAASAGGSTERRFAEFKIAFDDGLDYLDPGLSYTVEGWSIMLNVHLTPLTYRLEGGPSGATLIPGLAEDLPEISEDGQTYRFTIREGLTYSNGQPVKASDWKASIKRLFLINSPGSGFFTSIDGAAKFAETKKGDIAGIITDDTARTVEIRLTDPRGDFAHVLAMMFSAVVPANTPAKDQSAKGVPATGPYMVESHVPNRTVTLVRNPQWKGIEGIPDGNPDKMTFTVYTDDSAALQSVLDGTNDYDFREIPADRLGEVQNEHGERLKIFTPANTYYFFMNTRVRPFNDVNVRKALNHAIDREALVRLYGGVASPTQNVLPPTYPQYEKLSLYAHDLDKAQQLVQAAGVEGMAVTAWAPKTGVSEKFGEYLADVLNQMGFKSTLKTLDGTVYWPTIGNQRTKAQTGFANWYQDYPHPLNWFDTLLNGNRITNEHNNNFSNADVPAINAKIEELKKEPELTDEVNAEWADVDRMVMENALWAPSVNVQRTDFFSERMDLENCFVAHVLYQMIYSLTCTKS